MGTVSDGAVEPDRPIYAIVAGTGVLLLIGAFLLFHSSPAPKPTATTTAQPIVTPLPQPPAIRWSRRNRRKPNQPKPRPHPPDRSARSGSTPSPAGTLTSPRKPPRPRPQGTKPSGKCSRSYDHVRNFPRPARHCCPDLAADCRSTGQGAGAELLGQGTKLYEQGDVAGALEKFDAAYAAYASPKLMFNIGQCNRDLSRPVEALEAFEKFLESAADSSPDMIADARKSVAQLQKKLGRIQVNCETAGAEVSVDGKSVGLAPLPDPMWATPGLHQVTAKHASAAPAFEDVDVTAGSVSTVTVRLAPVAVPVAVSAPKAAPDFDLQERHGPGRKRGLVAGQEMDLGSSRLDGAAGCGRRHRLASR